jgi:hypothetical protein
MSIEPVNVQQLYPAQNKAAEVPAPTGRSYPQATAQAAGDSIALNKTMAGLPQFDKMQSDNSARNEIASSIKSADTTMGEIGTKIDSMKATLQIIVKNFPPYPPGSDERIKFLRNFNSLRQQIDEMSVPRPTETGTIAIKLQGLNTGPAGLNIPALVDSAPEATDRQIYRAINNLDTARNTLDLSRAGLASEAATLIANGQFADRR